MRVSRAFWAVSSLLGALGLVLATLVWLRPESAEPVVASVVSAAPADLRTCLDEQGVPSQLSERQANSEIARGAVTACLGPAVEEIAAVSGPDAAWDAVEGMLKEVPGLADCHEIAHYLAHGSAQFMPSSELIPFSRPLCEYGFLDGVIMVIDEENPSAPVEQVVQLAEQACRAYPLNGPDLNGVASNCFHGIGHVLWQRLAPDVDAVLKGCLQLPDWTPAEAVPPSAQCVGGAAMNFSAAVVDGTGAVPEREFPGDHCAGLPGQVQRECLAYSVGNDLRQRNGNARAYLRWCTDPSSGISMLDGCFSALAGQAGFFRVMQDYLVPCVEIGEQFDLEYVCAASAIDGLRATSDFTHSQAVEQVCNRVPRACSAAREVPERT